MPKGKSSEPRRPSEPLLPRHFGYLAYDAAIMPESATEFKLFDWTVFKAAVLSPWFRCGLVLSDEPPYFGGYADGRLRRQRRAIMFSRGTFENEPPFQGLG